MRYPKSLLQQNVVEASAALFSDLGVDRSLEMIEQAAEHWPFPVAAWRVREHRTVMRNLFESVAHGEQAARAAVLLWREGMKRDALVKLSFEVIADLAESTPLIDAHLWFLDALTAHFDGVNWADLCKAEIPQAPLKALQQAGLAVDELRAALDFAVGSGDVAANAAAVRALPEGALRPETAAFAALRSGASGDLAQAERDYLDRLEHGRPEGSAAAVLRATTFRSAVIARAAAQSPEGLREELRQLWQGGVRADQVIKLLDGLHIAMRADPPNERWEVILDTLARHCSDAERTLAAVELASGGARADRIPLALAVAPDPLPERLRDRLWEYATAAHGDAPMFVRQMLACGIPPQSCPLLARAVATLRHDRETLALLGPNDS